MGEELVGVSSIAGDFTGDEHPSVNDIYTMVKHERDLGPYCQ